MSQFNLKMKVSANSESFIILIRPSTEKTLKVTSEGHLNEEIYQPCWFSLTKRGNKIIQRGGRIEQNEGKVFITLNNSSESGMNKKALGSYNAFRLLCRKATSIGWNELEGYLLNHSH